MRGAVNSGIGVVRKTSSARLVIYLLASLLFCPNTLLALFLLLGLCVC